MNDFIIQLIGFIAYFLLGISYFMKDKKSILLIQIFAYIGFMIHYYLLGGKTGTICNLIGLLVLIVIYIFSKNKNNNKNKILVMITIPSLVIISILTYQNIYSLFPIMATTISILSFLSDDENKIRFIGIISALLWFVYAIVYKSYAAFAFEVFTIATTTISFIKNKKNKKT